MIRDKYAVSSIDKQLFEQMFVQIACLVEEVAKLKSKQKILVHILEQMLTSISVAADPDVATIARTLSLMSANDTDISMENNAAISDHSLLAESTIDAAELEADVDAMILDESGIDEKLLSPVIEMAGESDVDLDVSMKMANDEADGARLAVVREPDTVVGVAIRQIGAEKDDGDKVDDGEVKSVEDVKDSGDATECEDDGNSSITTDGSESHPIVDLKPSSLPLAKEDSGIQNEIDEFERTEHECELSDSASSDNINLSDVVQNDIEIEPIRFKMPSRQNYKYSIDDDNETKFLISMS